MANGAPNGWRSVSGWCDLLLLVYARYACAIHAVVGTCDSWQRDPWCFRWCKKLANHLQIVWQRMKDINEKLDLICLWTKFIFSKLCYVPASSGGKHEVWMCQIIAKTLLLWHWHEIGVPWDDLFWNLKPYCSWFQVGLCTTLIQNRAGLVLVLHSTHFLLALLSRMAL